MDNSNIANLQPSSKTMSVRNLGQIVTDSIGVNDMDEREREKGRDIQPKATERRGWELYIMTL